MIPRPAGQPGFITWPTGAESLAVKATLDAETYYRALDHRPNEWGPTRATFTPRAEGAHDSWCDEGELDLMCPECAREAHPDRDEVVGS
jgi:hypothetical protein